MRKFLPLIIVGAISTYRIFVRLKELTTERLL